MAITPAEKQRAYRLRQKEQKRDDLKKAGEAISDLRLPFWQFYQETDTQDFRLALDLAGFKHPDFEDDRGPKEFVQGGAIDGVDEPFEDMAQSVGRAEVMVGSLIDAAASLAAIIRDYHQQEIKARLAELEASDLSDPETKKAALVNAARLIKMLDQLDKQVRITFPQWKVTG